MYLCVYISAMHVPRRTWFATEDTFAGLQSKLVDCCSMKGSSKASQPSRQVAPEVAELLERGRKRQRRKAQSNVDKEGDVEMSETGGGQPSMVAMPEADDKEQEVDHPLAGQLAGVSPANCPAANKEEDEDEDEDDEDHGDVIGLLKEEDDEAFNAGQAQGPPVPQTGYVRLVEGRDGTVVVNDLTGEMHRLEGDEQATFIRAYACM